MTINSILGMEEIKDYELIAKIKEALEKNSKKIVLKEGEIKVVLNIPSGIRIS